MTSRSVRGLEQALIVIGTMMIAACGGAPYSPATSGADTGVSSGGTGGRSSANQAPTIVGTPQTTATVGQPYQFQPEANDLDGDALHFVIENKPSWAGFDASNGTLSGTPTAGDVGTYAAIRISTSDGTATTNLAAFDIGVQAIATGQVTLSWSAPTQNEDGTPLTDLAGYKIYYGRAADTLDMNVRAGVGVASAVIDNLGPGTWYFAMTSLNSQGVESERTSAIAKLI